MKAIKHLTIRVAWHDSQWNGHVCKVSVKKDTFGTSRDL